MNKIEKEMAKLKKDFGHEIKKAAEYIGKSVYNKMKETL